MSITGLPGQGSVRVGIPIADSTAGNLLALGVMMALFQRHTTGEGRWVHTSLLEAMVFMLDFQASRWLLAHEVAGQAGNDHPTGIPTGVFPTADRPITLAASSPRQWERFCEALGRPEWKVRGDWGSREGAPAIAQPSMLPSPRSRGRSQPSLGGGAGRCGHPLRPDQQHRPGLCRSSGAASRPRSAGIASAAGDAEDGGSTH